ncbi:MAG: hypothetical protein ACREAM_15050, partial [Blastocatellia bacterium]
LDLALAPALAQALARALALSEESDAAQASNQILRKAAQNNDRATPVFRASEQIFFVPESTIEPVTKELRKLAAAKDDWTRLVAASALLMMGYGTPEMCDERNALLDKGVRQPRQFTFPADLSAETGTEEFREQLPEILDLIFAHTPGDPWLRRELFDPAQPESKYFLSKPREFFILAADALDPKGETELSQWRKRLAGDVP